MIRISDVFFPLLSNGVGSFPEIFHFRLQIVQNVLYLKKCIFNIFFYSLDRTLSIFYVGKDSFQRVPERFSARNRMRKSRSIRRAGLYGTARGLPSPRCLIIIFYNLIFFTCFFFLFLNNAWSNILLIIS